jgi:hypothetical protein
MEVKKSARLSKKKGKRTPKSSLTENVVQIDEETGYQETDEAQLAQHEKNKASFLSDDECDED